MVEKTHAEIKSPAFYGLSPALIHLVTEKLLRVDEEQSRSRA